MRIAYVVVAATTMAGRGQFFWGTGPGGCRAVPQGAARPEVSYRGARRSIKVPTPFDGHVLRALARGLTASIRLNRASWHRGPGLLRCGSDGAQHTHC